jgi:D-alanyl-D-alanine carboxypeptidase
MRIKKTIFNIFQKKLLFSLAIISIIIAYLYLMIEIKKTDEIINGINRNALFFDISLNKKRTPYYLPLWEEIKDRLIIFEKKFIEVNLDEMKTKIYNNGEIIQEIPILAKGNPKNWGGTPSGIYKILNKHNSAYSNSVQVHMPFAIHYYGKYFLHGIPYYSDGTAINSIFSGGCVRYTNENSKKFFNFTEQDMPILVIDKNRDNFEYKEIKEKYFLDISAESFLVADLGSGAVLLEKNSNNIMSIASITKLMTAIVVSENITLNRTILVNQEMLNCCNTYGETPEIKSGYSYQLIDILYPLLIKSSNQSAEILSYFLGKDETIKLMNEKALSLNMTKTQFHDMSGLSEKNISTATDLFYLARYLNNNFEPILSISKSERVNQVQFLKFDLNKIQNKNIFIHDPAFKGGKTGFTNASANTALFIFSFKNRDIVINLLKSKHLKKDTQLLYEWILENYFKEIITEN